MVPQKIGRWISTPCTRGRTGFFPWATRSTTRGAGYTGKARMEASGSHFSRLRSLPSLVPVQGDNTVGQLAVCQPASHFRERDACVRASVDDEPWRAEKDPTRPSDRQSRPRSRPARHETAHPPPPPRHPPPSTRPAEPRRDKPGRASRACTAKSPTFSSASLHYRLIHPRASGRCPRTSPSRWVWVRFRCRGRFHWLASGQTRLCPVTSAATTTHSSTDPIPFGGRHRNQKYDPSHRDRELAYSYYTTMG